VPLDSRVSNVRFCSLSPENCHSAVGQPWHSATAGSRPLLSFGGTGSRLESGHCVGEGRVENADHWNAPLGPHGQRSSRGGAEKYD
jgi:hypothetical protein